MAREDTQIGGGSSDFPSTVWSDLLAAGDPAHPDCHDRLARLLQTYWKPVYAYIRASWKKSIEDSKDLTQAFLLLLLEKEYLSRLRPEKGSFRGYLKVALRNFLITRNRSDEVRRFHTTIFSLEVPHGELVGLDLKSPGETPEEAYDRVWFHTVFRDSIEQLESTLVADGKEVYWKVFEGYCLRGVAEVKSSRVDTGEEPSGGINYRELAGNLGICESDVRNFLAHARRCLRRIMKGRVRDYVATDDEVDRELDAGAQI